MDTLPPGHRPWIFGGGSSLAVHYGHRTSYDVDAFLWSTAAIRALSPNRNQAVREFLGGRRFDFPGHYLKLHLDDGEIDFLNGDPIGDNPTSEWEFEGRILLIDNPWESALKKVFYRPSTFKVRDVFDVAAVVERHPEELAAVLSEVAEKIPLVADRVDAMLADYETHALDAVNPTEAGRHLLRREAAESVLDFLRAWQVRANPTRTSQDRPF